MCMTEFINSSTASINIFFYHYFLNVGRVRVELEERDLDAGAGSTISKGAGDTKEWQIDWGWGRREGVLLRSRGT